MILLYKLAYIAIAHFKNILYPYNSKNICICTSLSFAKVIGCFNVLIQVFTKMFQVQTSRFTLRISSIQRRFRVIILQKFLTQAKCKIYRTFTRCFCETEMERPVETDGSHTEICYQEI